MTIQITLVNWHVMLLTVALIAGVSAGIYYALRGERPRTCTCGRPAVYIHGEDGWCVDCWRAQ